MNRFLPVSLFPMLVAWMIIMIALTLPVATAGATPTFASLYSFPDTNINEDGAHPQVSMIQASDGNFYGTTHDGGTAGYGTIFKMTSAGTLITLVDFAYANGSSPNALVQGSDGTFYGTTEFGGTYGSGTVFKMSPTGVLTTLANFQYATTGAYPTSGLAQGNDGNFYGIAGGGPAGQGIVFKMTPTGTLTSLFNFTGTNGYFPSAFIKGADGDFYGTTTGGGTPGNGTVFKITSAGLLTTLANFAATNGDSPNTLIEGTDGNFYGTTKDGGANEYGTVFKVTPTGALTKLTDFTGTNGFYPNALIQGSDGNLYGVTPDGGTFGDGTAFKIVPSGTLTTLVNFDDVSHGASPSSLVQGSDGNLYGTTLADASVGTGTIFKMTAAGVISTLYVFSEFSNEGANPKCVLVQGTDGDFYGTSQFGGSFGYGIVFKTTPSGVVTTLHSFGGLQIDGSSPAAGLILGQDGSFYGTTVTGGTSMNGTVFKITSTGLYSTLHSFSQLSQSPPYGNSDGSSPYNSLIQGSDGNFYGTTYAGGSSNGGTLFKITPSGTLTTLINFTRADVSGVQALVQGRDSNFYCTSENGGANGNGTVLKVTPAGTLSILYSFSTLTNSTNSDGRFPAASLVQGNDGNFYGTAEYGGTNGYGTVFKVTPAGDFTTLYSFSDDSRYTNLDGASPAAGLIQGSDGNFYGTTTAGGANRDGTVFSITPTGSFTTLHNFDYTDGFLANSFVQGSNGNFYGTTQSGGSTGNGTIFQLTGPAPALTWTCKDVAAASDGTARMLWDRSDGAAGIWALNANDAQTSYGPTYGPFADTHGTWSAKAVSAASDGNTKMLWTRSDGAAGVWTLNAAGTQTAVGPTYGPYSDSHGTWSAADIAAGPGGTTKMLWTRSDGGAGMWTLNTTNTQTVVGPAYGPFAGWSAKAVGASGDGTAHILWINVNRTAGLWTLNASDVETSTGTVYGPYSDSHGTWSAGDMATNSDGTSNVLWNRSDGAAGVWTFSAPGVQAKVGPVYGPYTGFTAAALDAASDQSRVLWIKSNRAAGLWSFNAADTATISGTVYGPY